MRTINVKVVKQMYIFLHKSFFLEWKIFGKICIKLSATKFYLSATLAPTLNNYERLPSKVKHVKVLKNSVFKVGKMNLETKTYKKGQVKIFNCYLQEKLTLYVCISAKTSNFSWKVLLYVNDLILLVIPISTWVACELTLKFKILHETAKNRSNPYKRCYDRSPKIFDSFCGTYMENFCWEKLLIKAVKTSNW